MKIAARRSAEVIAPTRRFGSKGTEHKASRSGSRMPAFSRSTPFEDLPQYLSVDELASYLGIGRTLAYDYARAHGVRIGRLLRVPREVTFAKTVSAFTGETIRPKL
jgi:hypothetical protein